MGICPTNQFNTNSSPAAAVSAKDLRLRGSNRDNPVKAPVFLGALHPAAYRFLAFSLERAAVAARHDQNSRQPQAEK